MRLIAAFSLLAVLATASPLQPRNNDKKKCVVASSDGGDDSPAFHDAVAECSSDAVIVLSEGVRYNFLTPVKAHNLNNVELKFLGNMHLPENMTYVQELVAGNAEEYKYWYNLQGTNVKMTGSKNVTSGWFDGHGQQWYDGNPTNATGLPNRPHMFSLNFTGGSVTNLKVRKPPGAISSISGTDMVIKGSFFDASSTGGFPFNTDGFDVKGQRILIEDSVIINGDDAVAINDGAHDITVKNAFLSGPGCHGMSVGSLGKDNTTVVSVSNILFKDIQLVDALYGARFKSWTGGKGLASNITWENFKLQNVSYPIYVTQTYNNQATTQQGSGPGYEVANGYDVTSGGDSAVMMENFTWKNFRGNINTYSPGDGSCASHPCWYEVEGGDGTQAVIMNCASPETCKNYVLEDIQVVPESDAPPTVLCENVGATTNPNLGMTCENGVFRPT